MTVGRSFKSRVPLALASVALLFVGGLVTEGLAAKPDFSRPIGFVSDFADMISPEAKATITRIADEVKSKTGAEIAVATINTTGGVAIEPYAVDLFTAWGIGEKGKDNGILVLVAKDDHQMFIKPGYGLEGAIPDATAFAIYRDVLRPGFRAGEYDKALVTAVNMIAGLILKENGQTYAYADSVPAGLLLARRAGGASNQAVSVPRLMLSGMFIFFVVIMIVISLARSGFRRMGGSGFWMGGFGGGSGGSSGGFGGGFGGFGGGGCGGGGAGGGW